MLGSHQVEELICMTAALDRETLIERLAHFEGDFPVDFTVEFLESLSVDRLRHIFLALCLQAQHLPADVEAAPAAA